VFSYLKIYFYILNNVERVMFRKTWKQIKILVIVVIILICLPRSILPLRSNDVEKTDLEEYRKLNDSEQRLIEYRDNDEALRLKVLQLEIINKSRKQNNAPQVKLDILASRVANKISREAADNEYIGHWNMAGEEPYLRYAFAGGCDHVAENAYGEWSSDNYDVSPSLISSMMKKGHSKFMAERSPNDGHRKNIIAKSHNFVGIGFCMSGKQFRYYEEFIDRYLEFENIPSSMKVGDQLNITVKTNGESYLYYVVIYREKWPQPLAPAQISKRGYYNDFTDQEYKNIVAWDLSKYRNGNIYSIPFSFSEEGLYYIQIFSDKKELTKPASLNTKWKTPESGIVIKVTR
jgi:uncharacterized protein YkwD